MSLLASATKSRRPFELPAGLETRIRDAIIQDLSPEERLLLMLWYGEGMTPDEIGEVLNLSGSRVLESHDRVVERLRRRASASPLHLATA